jgi:multidrug efflux pump subunit AcrA (membrane-fusion protein)
MTNINQIRMENLKPINAVIAVILENKFAAFAVVLASALLFAGCKQKADAQVRSEPVFAVSTAAVERGPVADYLMLSGDMVAGSSVDVYSDTAGTITGRYVSIGSRVVKGQPLAEVDPSQPGMQYMASVVEAPISGVIASLPAQIGMRISQSSPIAVISGGGGLEIQLYVAERFIYRIKMGLPCEITLDAYPNDSFRGRISEISPIVDTSSRTMKIKVNVDNPDDKLKAGMFANVKIVTESKNNVLIVPESAVLRRSGQQFVYKVQADPSGEGVKIVKRTPVTVGLVIDNKAEITDGLDAGDEIVVRGQTTLTDGSHVNVIQ